MRWSAFSLPMYWTGSLFCGLTIEWYYAARTCDISMPNYLQTALLKFQHPAPKRPQHAPHSWAKPTYGAQVQYSHENDSYRLLSAKTINLVQQIVGKLLCYSIAVDPTMITALGSIAAQQSKGTDKTYADTLWLFNYAAAHPNAKIRYTASDMILYIHSDAPVEARHATVKLLSLIYGRLDERALRVGKPISSSARSQDFYSSVVCTSTL